MKKPDNLSIYTQIFFFKDKLNETRTLIKNKHGLECNTMKYDMVSMEINLNPHND